MQPSAPVESTAPKRDVISYVIAVVFGCFAVYVDGRNDEVQAAVLVLLVGGVAIGLVGTRRRWIAAVILGLSIVISHPIANVFHLGSDFAQTAPNLGMLIALVPALIGTAVGVAIRSGMHGAIKQL
jgi:hypothetical protein